MNMWNHIKTSFQEAVKNVYGYKIIKLNMFGRVVLTPFMSIFFFVAFFLELCMDHEAMK
jgi:hypothetical protein